jgi:hypothetical protein
VHHYQRGRVWLTGLRLNGWKGMKTGRLVEVARCGLIGFRYYGAILGSFTEMSTLWASLRRGIRFL